MGILIRFLVTAAAVYFLPQFVSGITVDTIMTAVLVGACLVFIHLVIKPVVKILTLPLNILTLGLFSVLLNGLFFWFVASIIDGISVSSLSAAIIGALIISLLNWLVSKFADKD